MRLFSRVGIQTVPAKEDRGTQRKEEKKREKKEEGTVLHGGTWSIPFVQVILGLEFKNSVSQRSREKKKRKKQEGGGAGRAGL